MIRRRRLILLAGLGTVSMTLKAQTPRPLRVGMLVPTSPAGDTRNGASLIPAALDRLGYAPGTGMVLDRRFAEGRLDHLDALAAELVAARVDVIVPSRCRPRVRPPRRRAAFRSCSTATSTLWQRVWSINWRDRAETSPEW